jgi:hypothetical protein
METISVGLWATNLEIPAVSLAVWLDFIDARCSVVLRPVRSSCRQLSVQSGPSAPR